MSTLRILRMDETSHGIHEKKECSEEVKQLIKDGRLLYSLGRHSFEKLAKDSGVRREVGGRILVNVKGLNKFLEDMFGQNTMKRYLLLDKKLVEVYSANIGGAI